MVLGKTGHDPRRRCKLVVSLVPFLLLAVDRTESKVQGGILWVSGKDLAQRGFGFVKVLLAYLGGGFHQPVGNRSADPAQTERFPNSATRIKSLLAPDGLHLAKFGSLLAAWQVHVPRPDARDGCWELHPSARRQAELYQQAVRGGLVVDWATTAAVRLNSNKNTNALTLTGLPNTWIGLLVAAFEGMRMAIAFRNALKKHSPQGNPQVRSRR